MPFDRSYHDYRQGRDRDCFIAPCISKLSSSRLCVRVLERRPIGSGSLHGGRVHFQSHQKSTSQHQPLADSSSHPIHVHTGWPRSHISRLRALNSSRSYFKAALARFTAWLQRRCFSHIALRAGKCQNTCRPRRHSDGTSWLVVPHHPIWLEAPRKGGALPAMTVGENKLQVRVSWKLATRHLVHVLRGLRQ